MLNFHGAGKNRSYFEGWYFKHQSSAGSLALIPAFHVGAEGARSASLQVLTDSEAWNIPFDTADFDAAATALGVQLGRCRFSSAGCRLFLRTKSLHLEGSLRYGPLTPTNGDIMGPFRFIPFMQCRHRVFSLMHRVAGIVTLNGTEYDFHDGLGYIEGDRGVSFPRRYLWTQCSRPDFCVMISVADIPFRSIAFTGCIASVLLEGREFRLATYLGVRLDEISDSRILLRQGNLELEAELLVAHARPLLAPQDGGMTRTIHESLCCEVRYRFRKNSMTLFDFTSSRASFESVWAADNSKQGGKN